MWKRLFPIACLLWICALHGPAAAQESAEYARATELGIAEFSQRNFEEARAHFLRAHALMPSARTLRALGMVEFELKNYVDSVHFLEDALASTLKPLDGPRRSETETLLQTANAYVARYHVRVAPDTSVLLDGDALEAPAELVLAIGAHQLEFRAPGRIAQRRALHVKGGERDDLTVSLIPLAAGKSDRAPPGAPRKDDQEGRRPLYKNPWLWSAVGIVVAGVTAGTLVAVYGRRDGSTSVEEPLAGTGGAPPLMPPP